MINEDNFISSTKQLVDDLKAISAGAGLAGDGNEFKIIIQVFLYKFLNDKFMYETKKLLNISDDVSWEAEMHKLSDNEYERLLMRLPATSAQLRKEHFLSYLYNNSNTPDFYKLFDETLISLGQLNVDIFSIQTVEDNNVVMFEGISKYILNETDKNSFCRAVINKLVNDFSFEKMFSQKYDFFSTIFEYLIKDYNINGGGVYAEYYTPRSVAQIISAILVEGEPIKVDCYDPAAGSGTLLMSLAHAIGENRCTIYSQDLSQKSSHTLRLNLVLNNLVMSIHNIIQGNTLTKPHHKNDDGTLKSFNYIVSNPPFKLDFSADRETLVNMPTSKDRFFAGIPSIPSKKKDKMAIYLMFIQHILYSLKDDGKAAIVVPTGFLTAQSGIEKKIREKLIDRHWLRGAVSMPSNIFATTGTNVSVIFIDKASSYKDAILIDASKLGIKTKDDNGNQKTKLSKEEEQKIITTFKERKVIDDFSVVVSYEDIKAKNCSFSAGQYFDVKIEYVDISAEEFEKRMTDHKTALAGMFNEAHALEQDILDKLEKLKFGE